MQEDADAQNWVGNRVRQLREEYGVSQEEFADRCGIHRTHLSKIERGKISPAVVTLSRIARTLNMKMSLFFEGWPLDPRK